MYYLLFTFLNGISSWFFKNSIKIRAFSIDYLYFNEIHNAFKNLTYIAFKINMSQLNIYIKS